MAPGIVEAIGFAAGVFTTGAALPQIVHALRRRTMRDVSLVMLLAMATGIALWLLYGLARGSQPLIVWNAISLGFYGVLLAMKAWYRGARAGNFPGKRVDGPAGSFHGAANVIEDGQR
jgi:MtN3 and saliva related transmembrane protein